MPRVPPAWRADASAAGWSGEHERADREAEGPELEDPDRRDRQRVRQSNRRGREPDEERGVRLDQVHVQPLAAEDPIREGQSDADVGVDDRQDDDRQPRRPQRAEPEAPRQRQIPAPRPGHARRLVDPPDRQESGSPARFQVQSEFSQ